MRPAAGRPLAKEPAPQGGGLLRLRRGRGRPGPAGGPVRAAGAGLVAAEPVLVEGSAVRLHPEAGRVLGIGFSGETVRLHLPLSNEAQREAARLGSPGLPGVGAASRAAPEAARLGSPNGPA